jgi:dihydrolipoamide dehydrogenase
MLPKSAQEQTQRWRTSSKSRREIDHLPSHSKKFKKILEKQRMKFMMKTKVVEVKNGANGHIVVVEPAAGGEKTELEADVVLVSVGRKPYTQGLGLEEVGVKTDKRGFVEIDEHFSTSVPNILAIGDCVRGPMLAHKAEDEGGAAVEQIFTGFSHINYDAIPSVIYTHPEVAWVGKTEEQLKQEGTKYKVGNFPMMGNSRARTNGM